MLYVRPGASGAPGDPVLVGRGAALGVLVSGVTLVAFCWVLASGAVVPITDTPSAGPAVACGVGTLVVVGAPKAPTVAPTDMPLFGQELGLEGLDMIGSVGVVGGEGGVGGNQLFKDSFVVGGGTGKVIEGVVDGVEETGGLVG
jgi:hypothetical protein